jgi:hypothetical protein
MFGEHTTISHFTASHHYSFFSILSYTKQVAALLSPRLENKRSLVVAVNILLTIWGISALM